MSVFSLRDWSKKLTPLGPEISVHESIRGSRYKGGIIQFNPGASDRKQILHPNKDVVTIVLQGRGILRLNDSERELAPEDVCHIPSGTPHDFMAATEETFMLFYLVIEN